MIWNEKSLEKFLIINDFYEAIKVQALLSSCFCSAITSKKNILGKKDF